MWPVHLLKYRTYTLFNILIQSAGNHTLNMHKLDCKEAHVLCCSLVLSYLNYCTEVWRNYYNRSLHSLSIVQKRAMWIIHNAAQCCQTTQIMFKARNNLLPRNIKKGII